MGRASGGGGNNATAFGGVQARAPRLEIKKDLKGMVSVPGATIIEVQNCKDPLMLLSAHAAMASKAQKAGGWCCCMQCHRTA